MARTRPTSVLTDRLSFERASGGLHNLAVEIPYPLKAVYTRLVVQASVFIFIYFPFMEVEGWILTMCSPICSAEREDANDVYALVA